MSIIRRSKFSNSWSVAWLPIPWSYDLTNCFVLSRSRHFVQRGFHLKRGSSRFNNPLMSPWIPLLWNCSVENTEKKEVKRWQRGTCPTQKMHFTILTHRLKEHLQYQTEIKSSAQTESLCHIIFGYGN